MAITKVTRTLLSTGIVDNSNATAITIDSSERVGIGTTSPARKVQIQDTSSTPYLSLVGPTNASAGIMFGDSDDETMGRVTYDNSNNSMQFWTNDSQKMLIDSSGNVGIGTSSPSSKLELYENVENVVSQITNNDGNFQLQKYQDDIYLNLNDNGNYIFRNYGSSGSSITERMRVDGSGRLLVGIAGTSDSDFGLFNVAVAGASTGRFHIGYGSNGDNYYTAGSSGIQVFRQDTGERMRINSDGDLLVGTTSIVYSGDERMSLVGNGNGCGIGIKTAFKTAQCLGLWNAGTSGTRHIIRFAAGSGGTEIGSISHNGSVITYGGTSDYRLKENVITLKDGLKRVKKLNPIQFDWKRTGDTSEGFIAHEIQDIFPTAVTGEKDGEEMQTVDYGKITPLLVKAIQEQQTQIDALQSEINLLKGE